MKKILTIVFLLVAPTVFAGAAVRLENRGSVRLERYRLGEMKPNPPKIYKYVEVPTTRVDTPNGSYIVPRHVERREVKKPLPPPVHSNTKPKANCTFYVKPATNQVQVVKPKTINQTGEVK